MQDSGQLPLLLRIEGRLAWFPLADVAIALVHQQRKKYYVAAERRRDQECSTDLRNFERKVWSQNGEDGILEEIFRRIGSGARFTVEFGIQSGSECNSRYLLSDRGWSAVLIDGSPHHVDAARKLYHAKPVRVLDRFITVENVLDIFAEAEVPRDPDLLSIDVDGNDYWLWEKILEAHRPRVVVIEYNARWVPPKRWVMPYKSDHTWDGSVRFGASLQSLTDLGAQHGFRLVGCDFAGVNAFFVREDQIGDLFPNSDRGAAYHYSAPLYSRGFGHPVRRRRRWR